MNDNTEYHIYVGLRDSQFGGEIVTENELREMIANFFSQKNISFSMYSAKGGYLHEDGRFVSENTLCINLIGAYDLDILMFATSLSMFMNQECSLVIKDIVKTRYL